MRFFFFFFLLLSLRAAALACSTPLGSENLVLCCVVCVVWCCVVLCVCVFAFFLLVSIPSQELVPGPCNNHKVTTPYKDSGVPTARGMRGGLLGPNLLPLPPPPFKPSNRDRPLFKTKFGRLHWWAPPPWRILDPIPSLQPHPSPQKKFTGLYLWQNVFGAIDEPLHFGEFSTPPKKKNNNKITGLYLGQSLVGYIDEPLPLWGFLATL